MCVTSVNNENGDDAGSPASLVEVDGVSCSLIAADLAQ
jgi:hypothetical protein